jgi:uncharacterized protein YecT (DUF1311 family)
MPERPVYPIDEVGEYLSDAVRFTKAMEEVLTFEKYGLLPLTQRDMNTAASETLKSKREELDQLLTTIRTFLANRDQQLAKIMPNEMGSLSHFDDAQDKWIAYRKANSDMVADMYRGGSIAPLIWASEATRMTESRIGELQEWFDYQSSL